ncbi:retinoic acid receptor gamma-like [Physella acuta]|uniref:retinoic acid receptor gamma-like n=1 Tax=Physella acuta TaxID=109671 RepID=UPI0027DDC991|nr:retinoic acid receptor gamma-like [Physella acuta]
MYAHRGVTMLRNNFPVSSGQLDVYNNLHTRSYPAHTADVTYRPRDNHSSGRHYSALPTRSRTNEGDYRHGQLEELSFPASRAYTNGLGKPRAGTSDFSLDQFSPHDVGHLDQNQNPPAWYQRATNPHPHHPSGRPVEVLSSRPGYHRHDQRKHSSSPEEDRYYNNNHNNNNNHHNLSLRNHEPTPGHGHFDQQTSPLGSRFYSPHKHTFSDSYHSSFSPEANYMTTHRDVRDDVEPRDVNHRSRDSRETSLEARDSTSTANSIDSSCYKDDVKQEENDVKQEDYDVKYEDTDYSDCSDDQTIIAPSPPRGPPSPSRGPPPSTRRPSYHDNNGQIYEHSSSSSSTSPQLSSPPANLVKPETKSSPSKHESSKSSNSAKTKTGKQTRGAQNLPPCRVCGNKASGLHFGVNTCEACNEFFRRSLKRGASYYCTKNKECQVYGKKRNACSFCRYRRCVEMGMSRDAIKTGRYSHKTRTEYAMEVEEFRQRETHRLEKEKYEVLLADLVKCHDKYVKNSTRVPIEELWEQEKMFLKLHKENRGQEYKYPLDSHLMRDRQILGEKTYEMEDASLVMTDLEMTEKWLRNYINYAKNVPGFKELALSDQASLVRGSWFEFWYLGAFRGYNSDLHVVCYPNGRIFHEDEILQLFGKDYTELSFSLSDRMSTLDVTPEEMVLIKTVCMTFPDRSTLQNREAVEKMHWLLVSCLLHTLETNRPGDSTIFPMIVGKLVELRSLNEVAMKAHKNAIYRDYDTDCPLLSEMVDTKTIYVSSSATAKDDVKPTSPSQGAATTGST